MVLCKHFQQGYCRFGSKCNFEHVDIKQLVKNDIESALNGKQFPFSCYGPFKDKPCVPNFIEDQSFEEVRLMCYEAKQKNCFEQFHQQFSIGAAEAINKMKTLLQPSYEVINVLTMIYDAPVSTSSNTSSTNTGSGTNNPFGLNAPADGGASSIFGKSTLSATTTTSSNVFGGAGIFGGGATTNNNALQQTGGIFGGQNNFGGQQQSSIFGQHTQEQGNAGSIFGGQPKPSIFGQQNTTVPVGGGIFAQAAQQTAPMFNQQQQLQQQQQQLQQQQQNQQMMQSQTSSSIFGQSGFGQQQTQANTFGQLQQQNPFSQATQPSQSTPQQLSGNTNVFGQAAQQNISAGPPSGFFQQVGEAMSNPSSQQQQTSGQHMQQQSVSQQPQDLTQTTISHPIAQNAVKNAVYSRLEDLTPAEIEAFKADFFEPGKLPFSPPPLELLN